MSQNILNPNSRYLTKSRFKLALECPTKLYYTQKKEYLDKKLDDEFLQALAKGGYQVGELAKCYFPGGINVEELDYDKALFKTNELLERENVIIYEAAFIHQNLFIRADVVVKEGNNLSLYEVKAKSFHPDEDKFTTRNGISSSWKPYIYDVAFQKYVIGQAFPKFKISAFLMLADKSKTASVDALNQRFLIKKDERGRTKIETRGDVSLQLLGEKLLYAANVDEIINAIYQDKVFADNPEKSFIEWIHFYAEKYSKDERIQADLVGACRDCEFKTTDEEEANGFKSGFKECWNTVYGFSVTHFKKPSILNIWDFRKKDDYIKLGKLFQADLTREDLEPKKSKLNTEPGLSRIDRQELQLNKSKDSDDSPYIDKEGLKAVFGTFKYPLHFIDFETSAVAIPFNANRRPYEQIAFQFSHHIIYADGTIEHIGQWLNTEQGKFPNFEFVRQLKKELEKDEGTIFRYAAHENSVLNAIHRQLRDSNEVDKEVLCSWIETITKATGRSTNSWEGSRNMLDLRELVLKYYYAPETNGSNSIKNILPAILNHSDFLKDKYSKPIYGRSIKSLNFHDQQWIEFDEDGKLINPYYKLEPIYKDIDQELLDNLTLDDDAELRDGGAAMTAYAQMQFTEMDEKERELIQASLLRYCELDTLAMVMIWEDWNHQIKN